MRRRSFHGWIAFVPVLICFWFVSLASGDHIQCEELLIGQYQCEEPKIDPETQSEENCQENHSTKVTCQLRPGLTCGPQNASSFQRDVPCRYTNGHSYETALLLSVFLGMFGIDRFYLGYPAIGLLKFSTLGFFFIFHLVDIILIATQVVGPSHGASYVIDFYGPRLIHLTANNETFYKPQDFR